MRVIAKNIENVFETQCRSGHPPPTMLHLRKLG